MKAYKPDESLVALVARVNDHTLSRRDKAVNLRTLYSLTHGTGTVNTAARSLWIEDNVPPDVRIILSGYDNYKMLDEAVKAEDKLALESYLANTAIKEG